MNAMFSVVLLALCGLTAVQSYQNPWDYPHHLTCPYGRYVKSIKSIHDNRREDRRWDVSCGGTGATVGCSWSGYVNTWDQPVLYYCNNNRVISGMESFHENKSEDRRFKFRCCGLTARKTPKNCYLTDWANAWDGYMNLNLNAVQVITGVYSVHHNSKEDRRWRFVICTI